MKFVKTYTFKGFGFDILLRDVSIKTIDGEDYPDININELKVNTVKALMINKHRLTGHQFKFIRTFLKLSYDELSEKIRIPPSTLRSWERKGSEYTGLSLDQEKAFRILAINQILDNEKNIFNIEVVLVPEFQSQKNDSILDISKNLTQINAKNF